MLMRDSKDHLPFMDFPVRIRFAFRCPLDLEPGWDRFAFPKFHFRLSPRRLLGGGR